MTHLTPAELDALEALEKAATPSLWTYVESDMFGPDRYVGDIEWPEDSNFIMRLRNAAPALLAAARERDELGFKLGVYRDATEISAMSWSGFNILGDKKSISEVQRIENRSSQLEVYQRAFEERTNALRALLTQSAQAFAIINIRLSENQTRDDLSQNAMWAADHCRLMTDTIRKALAP